MLVFALNIYTRTTSKYLWSWFLVSFFVVEIQTISVFLYTSLEIWDRVFAIFFGFYFRVWRELGARFWSSFAEINILNWTLSVSLIMIWVPVGLSPCLKPKNWPHLGPYRTVTSLVKIEEFLHTFTCLSLLCSISHRLEIFILNGINILT